MPDLPNLNEQCTALNLYTGDMIKDDLYFWTIYWTNQSDDDKLEPISIQMEEEGLKISILIGMYELFRGESSYK